MMQLQRNSSIDAGQDAQLSCSCVTNPVNRYTCLYWNRTESLAYAALNDDIPTMQVLYSIIESPTHPHMSDLYRQLEIKEIQLTSMRKAISELKRTRPDFVVAEFFYGYGNNYAGVNVSNLDVFLYSLEKYAPSAKVIVIVDKAERKYLDRLPEALRPDIVLVQPVNRKMLQEFLLGSSDPV